MTKAHDAFRTISEVATELGVPKHVLRFWESKFPQIKPMKRGGGRRYYRPEDMQLLSGIRQLLHADRYTIKGVQKILREQGVETVKRAGSGEAAPAPARGKAGTSAKARGARVRAPAKSKDDEKAQGQSRDTVQDDTSHGGVPEGKAASGSRERRAQIDGVIQELEACRALLVGARPPTKAKKTAARKARSARSA